MTATSAWFENWFDSPYYHLLYKHRDYTEADAFVAGLAEHLALPPGARILDIACGAGRHALSLSRRGYDVVGIDLSPNSIAGARANEQARLRFAVHDMRECFEAGAFDAAVNLFTSFGYFETDRENQQVVSAATESLRSGGVFVLDYLNADLVSRGLVPREQVEIDGVQFSIHRFLRDGVICKQIEIRDPSAGDSGDHPREYCERVRAYGEEAFRGFFQVAGLADVRVFGGYDLEPFDVAVSPRFIITGTRP